ncbi:MAG TPA: hypothetical protein VJ397_05770, partial [Thermoplasmata archaeon]|nr:hypothetical protein [Thermoplasmata archaeon]
DGGAMSTVVAVTVSDNYVPTLVRELPDVTLIEDQEILGLFDLDDYFEDADEDSLYYTYGNTHVDITIRTDHSVDFHAHGDWFGQETVGFRAIDPENARAEDLVLVTVSPVNDAPTLLPLPDLVVHYFAAPYDDYNYTFDLTPYVADVDNTAAELSVWTSDPVHINFTAAGSGAGEAMLLHYPASMLGAIVEVVLTVSDGLAQASDTFRVTVSADWPPEILQANLDRLVPPTFQEDTTLEDAFALADYFLDPDGEPVYYASGNSSILVLIDPATSVVRLGALQDWFGVERVTFRAVNAAGALVEFSLSVTVTPVNDAPVIGPVPEIVVEAGKVSYFDMGAYITDVDSDAFTITVNALDPDRARVAGNYLVLDYPQAGSDILTVTVGDGEALASRVLSVRVVPHAEPAPLGVLGLPFLLLTVILAGVLLALAVRRQLLKMVIQEVFLIHADGTVLARVSGEASGLSVDEDLFTAMLIALQAFARESFRNVDGTPLKRVEFGRKKVLLERGEHAVLAVVYTGFEKPAKVALLRETLRTVEAGFRPVLTAWDGNVDRVAAMVHYLRPFVDRDKSSRLARAGRGSTPKLLEGLPPRADIPSPLDHAEDKP